jgi:hypothetical protein
MIPSITNTATFDQTFSCGVSKEQENLVELSAHDGFCEKDVEYSGL